MLYIKIAKEIELWSNGVSGVLVLKSINPVIQYSSTPVGKLVDYYSDFWFKRPTPQDNKILANCCL